MKRSLQPLALALGAALALAGTAARAEQTIGIQAGGSATDAVATARVNIRVYVPKIVVLRVGDAANTVPAIDFTYAVGALTAGDSQSYTGATAPTLTPSIARTNPTGTAGDVVVGAWTNVPSTTMVCSRAALGGGETLFAAGATTAAGVIGSDEITVALGGGGNQLPHPGGASATLSHCDGSTSVALTDRTIYTGTYTYGIAGTFDPTTVLAGAYGAVVTYTATAP